MAIQYLDSNDGASTSSRPASVTVGLSGLSGSNCFIVLAVSARSTIQTGWFFNTPTWNGVPMNLAVARDEALNGFGSGKARIYYLEVGTLSGLTADAVITCNDNSSEVTILATVIAYSGGKQDPDLLNGTASSGFVSGAVSITLSCTSNPTDEVVGVACFAQTAASGAAPTSGQTKLTGESTTVSSNAAHVVGSEPAEGGASTAGNWGSFNSSYSYVMASFEEGAAAAGPVINDVDGGSFVDPTDTNLTINGSDMDPGGTTSVYYADGSNFGTATKAVQTISSITSTTINWDAINLGAIGTGSNYLFVVTDEGGGGEAISPAFPIIIDSSIVPAARFVHTTDGTIGSVLVGPTAFSDAKAAVLRATANTSDDTVQADAVLSICFVDETKAKGSGMGAGNFSSQRKQIQGTGALFIMPNGSGSDVVRGTPSLGPSGLSIDFTINTPGYKIEIIVIGGTYVEASVDAIAINASPKIGIGFRADLLLGQCVGLGYGTPSDTSFALMSFGVCIDLGSPAQWACSANFESEPRNTNLKDGTFLSQTQGTVPTWEMDITSIDSDGYSWAGSNTDGCYVLALRMPGRSLFVGTFVKNDVTPGTTQNLPDVGFDPGALFFASSGRIGQSPATAVGGRFSMGLALPGGQDVIAAHVLPETGSRTAEQFQSFSNVVAIQSTPGTVSVLGTITDFAQISEMTWTNSGAGSSITIGMLALDVGDEVVPDITLVNGGVDVPAIATAVPVVGTDFAPGNTTFYYADGTDFGTASLVMQAIDTVTSTTFNWSTVDVGSIGGGNNYVFAVTDDGGPSEKVSLAFAVTVVEPNVPVITDVDGGVVADVTDTNLPVNGSDLFTVGTTSLYLADGTNFGTATLVQQNISAITAPTLNWDDVNEGALTLGPLWLFVVTDEGGLNEKVSAAFAIEITEPATPIIDTVNGEPQAADVFFVGTNIPIVGTEFTPGGVTEVWLADGTNLATASKFIQAISAITATTINWDAVTQGTLNPGLLYLFVVTQAGLPAERTSPAFALIVYEVFPPLITAVNGGSSVNEVDTNLTVTGQFFRRPGVEAFYLADGTDFGLATKQLQTIGALDFTMFTWPTIVLGAVGTGARYLFYVTDEGGPNEQISTPFSLTIIPSTGITRIEMIGDGTGLVLCPVIDSDPDVDPDVNVLVIRDHANWTGLGKWYFARDFKQWPTANNDITLKGQLPGPWADSKSVRVNDVAVTNADRILADEYLNIFTEAGREVFTVGVWIHKLDLVNNDVDHCSLFQIETASPGYYMELFVTTSGGALHLGVAYDNGSRTTLIHSESLVAATEDLAGWVHVVAEFSQTGNHLRLVQGGNEEVSSAGSGPVAGLYEFSFILHDFVLVGGPSTPNIYYRFSTFWYGFGSLSAGNITTLGTSITQIQYELSLRTIMAAFALSDGPIHYYRCNDLIPDRFIHNHAEDFGPGVAVGGVMQRDLDVPPFGVAKRLFSGCTVVCPVSQNADFDDWGATMFAHIRFLGTVNDTGVLFRLIDTSTGASIELSKISAGPSPNELNGRLRFRAYSNGPTPIVEKIWDNPSLDPFDGTFLAYGVTTSETGTGWKISFGDIGTWTVLQTLDSVPPWHGFSYTEFQIGGLNMDIHSCGYHSVDDLDIHDLWYATWSTVVELLEFAEARNYDGFYWCQNDVVND